VRGYSNSGRVKSRVGFRTLLSAYINLCWQAWRRRVRGFRSKLPDVGNVTVTPSCTGSFAYDGTPEKENQGRWRNICEERNSAWLNSKYSMRVLHALGTSRSTGLRRDSKIFNSNLYLDSNSKELHGLLKMSTRGVTTFNCQFKRWNFVHTVVQ